MQQCEPGRVRARDLVERLTGEIGICSANLFIVILPSLGLLLPSACHAIANFVAALQRWWQAEISGGNCRNLNGQINTIQQGTGDPRLIVSSASCAAFTGLPGTAAATAAWIHGGDQLNARGVTNAMAGACDDSFPGL